jgi:hypothetical protein
MKDDHGAHQAFDSFPVLEEEILHLLWVTQIESALDVTPAVFEIEATIYDH